MSIACPSLIGSHYPNLCAAVDHYCERTNSALDAEPINALTNAGFLIAAWGAWLLYLRHPAASARVLIRILISIIVTVGHGRYDTCRHRRVPAVVHCTDPRCEGLPGFADRHALLVAPAECYTALRLGKSGHSAWSTAPRLTTLQGNQSSLVRVCYTQAPVIHAAPGYRRCS